MYPTSALVTLDFRLRHAIHAVLTQRRFDEVALSAFVSWAFDDGFVRGPSEVGSGLNFSSIILKPRQKCVTASEKESACLTEEGAGVFPRTTANRTQRGNAKRLWQTRDSEQWAHHRNGYRCLTARQSIPGSGNALGRRVQSRA